MALYNREHTESFYSAFGIEDDYCHYCTRLVTKRLESKEISYEEATKIKRELVGKLTNKRILKFKSVGHTFCICPDCLDKIHEEVLIKFGNPSKQNDTTNTADTVNEVAEKPKIAKEPKTKSTAKDKEKKSGNK